MSGVWWKRIVGGVFLASMLTGCSGVNGEAHQDSGRGVMLSSYMPAGQQVVPPFGFIDFCLRSEKDCEVGTNEPATPLLTPRRWSELDAVNDYVNRLPQIADEDNYQRSEYWTYPNERGGDCEDLALLKRKMLIERGWPASAVLIATVEQWNGAYHSVLIVETDRGEFVLDNLKREIVGWQDAPYVWKKRQSRERAHIWVDLDRSTFRSAVNDTLPPLGETPPFIVAARKIAQPVAGTGTGAVYTR